MKEKKWGTALATGAIGLLLTGALVFWSLEEKNTFLPVPEEPESSIGTAAAETENRTGTAAAEQENSAGGEKVQTPAPTEEGTQTPPSAPEPPAERDNRDEADGDDNNVDDDDDDDDDDENLPLGQQLWEEIEDWLEDK